MAKNVRMARGGEQREGVSLSKKQEDLQKQLSRAIRAALPWARKIDDSLKRAQSPYKHVAEILVKLRHECPGPNGQRRDLKGRSSAYRAVVRSAYAKAGADPNSSLSKRLTAGTAYWVRKILLERYGEKKLCEMGILPSQRTSSPPRSTGAESRGTGKQKLGDLEDVIGALNLLASDPEMNPTEDLVRAAIRAVNLLRQRLKTARADNNLEQVAV